MWIATLRTSFLAPSPHVSRMSLACQWARRDLALLGGWAHFEWEKSAVSTSGYWGGPGMQCPPRPRGTRRAASAGDTRHIMKHRVTHTGCVRTPSLTHSVSH